MKTAMKERTHCPGMSSERPAHRVGSEDSLSTSMVRSTRYDSCFRAIPSVLEGLMPMLDIGGTLLEDIHDSQAGYELDIAALRNDWILVGQDIRHAFFMYSESANHLDT